MLAEILRCGGQAGLVPCERNVALLARPGVRTAPRARFRLWVRTARARAADLDKHDRKPQGGVQVVPSAHHKLRSRGALYWWRHGRH